MRIRSYGIGALLVDELPLGRAATLRTELLHACKLRGVRCIDVVPTSTHLLVRHDASTEVLLRTMLGELEEVLQARATSSTIHDAVDDPRPSTTLEIPVQYDGADLEQVARSCQLEVEEVVDVHSGTLYVVEFFGFAPGFAYLGGLSPRLQLPRRSSPRSRVPRGSVAIAATYTAVYPQESPGGWHLLGTTTLELWSLHRESPSLLQPGDRVRFVPTGISH